MNRTAIRHQPIATRVLTAVLVVAEMLRRQREDDMVARIGWFVERARGYEPLRPTVEASRVERRGAGV